MSAEAWTDRHGDVWTLGDDGLLHTPETKPFPREYVEKKWGPLYPAPDQSEESIEWGVRLTRRDGAEQVQRFSSEEQARTSHAINQEWFTEGDPVWCKVWSKSELVFRRVGAWVEAGGVW